MKVRRFTFQARVVVEYREEDFDEDAAAELEAATVEDALMDSEQWDNIEWELVKDTGVIEEAPQAN